MAARRHKRALLLFILETVCSVAYTDTHLVAPQGGDDSNSITSGGARGSNGAGVAQRQLLGAAGQPYLEEPGRMVVLYTTFGPIRIRLLERLAPRVTALVWSLALTRGCSNAYKCAFYRCAWCACAEMHAL